MDKRARLSLNAVLILVLFVSVLYVSFVYADIIVTAPDLGTNYEFRQGEGVFFNITVNNTGVATGGNITQVNITFPLDFTVDVATNGTNVFGGFNVSGNVSGWSNFTNFLVDGGVPNSTFWVNVTAGTPGNYNVSVLTMNGSGVFQTNITVTVNDTVAPNVTAIAPAAGNNLSGIVANSQAIFLNATVLDAGTIQAVFFNVSNITTQLNFIEAFAVGDGYNTTLNASNYTDGFYNITVHANDTVNNLNTSVSVQIYIDSVLPIANAFTNPVSRGNYSQNLVFNISVADGNSSIQAVIFNITNLTNNNFNYTATQEGATTNYTVTVNTTQIDEGFYNVTAYVNDTAGNLNGSSSVSNILIDNNFPQVSGISPAAGANLSGVVSSSYPNGQAIPLNVTVVDVLTDSVWFNVTNNSVAGGYQHLFIRASQLGNGWNATFNTTNLTDGFYNITVYANDTLNNLNSSVAPVQIYIDSVLPIVFVANITSPVAGGNYSGNLLFNTTAEDANSGIGAVFFNITNSSGQNGTFTATREGLGNNVTFNISSLNTVSFGNGIYNVTVHANDTAGNVNASSTILNVVFDNAGPVLDFSCTPLSVYVDEVITCSCGATAVSGISGTASFTVNPATGSSGTFTSAGCSAQSNSGVSNSVAGVSYTVSGRGPGVSGSSGGGGGGGIPWKTYAADSVPLSEKKEGVKSELQKNERIRVLISKSSGGNEKHHIGVTGVTATGATVVVSSHPQTVTLSVGKSEKFDVLDDGYYDMLVTLNGIITGNKADLTITSVHEKIPSEPTVEVPEEVESAPPAKETSPSETEEEPEPEKSRAGWTVLIVVIVLVVVVVVYFNVKGKGDFSGKRKKK
jgi:hypothetical protein